MSTSLNFLRPHSTVPVEILLRISYYHTLRWTDYWVFKTDAERLPGASDWGPVVTLGVLPDHITQGNFALADLSFSQPQKVELSKSQSKTIEKKDRFFLYSSSKRQLSCCKGCDHNAIFDHLRQQTHNE